MDATKPKEMIEIAVKYLSPELCEREEKFGFGADLVLNCVSVENTEFPSLLVTVETGTVIFFSMATSFSRFLFLVFKYFIYSLIK